MTTVDNSSAYIVLYTGIKMKMEKYHVFLRITVIHKHTAKYMNRRKFI